MENLVELTNVSKRYEGFALDNLSFSIKKGYVTGFIGANGAGKSTTIKLIMNLIKRDSGDIKIFGKDNRQHEQEIKERIGFVYDENYYYEDLTISELRSFVAPFYKKWDQGQFEKHMDLFQLPSNLKIKKMSKGMKMKVSLVFALSHQPEFIIMDEPTSGLDPVFRREILDVLYDIMLDGERTIFFSTHITTDLDKIADYITFIQRGKLVFSEEKDLIKEKYGVVKGDLQLLDRDTEKEFVGIRKTGVGFTALAKDAERVRKVFGREVLIEQATLEDIMYYSNKEGSHV